MDRYAACFLRKVLWLEDHFHQYYVQDRFVECDDLRHVALRRFDDAAETIAWLQACLGADPFWTMTALRRFLAWECLQPAVHRLDDTQVIVQAAARIYSEPHVVVQEPLLDDRYALQRIQTLTARLQDQLTVLANSAPAPAGTQPAPDNLPGLIQAIPAAVRKHADTFKERTRARAELSILIHDPPLRELLLNFTQRYAQDGDGPLDVLAGLLCGRAPKAPSQAQARHLLSQLAEELKPLRMRNPLPKKELDPLALIQRKASEPEKNWVDLDYRYADGTGVAGAKYEVFDAGGAKLAAGTLGGDGTARAAIALGIAHVQTLYFDDPKEKAVLKASHPAPYPAPPGWQTRMSAALQGAWQTTRDAGEWTWGVIQGDFNEDPTMGQIVTNAVITAIPLVDQAGDARDIAANVKMLAWDKRLKESALWLGLFFTLIGLVPGIGSLLKGVLKLILKSAPIEKILAVFNHFMQGNGVKWLKELKAGKLNTYVDQAAANGHKIVAAAIDNLARLKQHMPARLTVLRGKTDDLLAGLRQTKAMINDQFDRIGRELTQKLDEILAKRTDDLPAGAAKSKVQKQQRAEAPEGDKPPRDHDGAEKTPKKYKNTPPTKRDIDLAKKSGKSAEQIAARKRVASHFYEKQGLDPDTIPAHLEGVDFNEPVEVVKLKEGTKLKQLQIPGAPQGNYYTTPDTPADKLGVSLKVRSKETGEIIERIENDYIVKQDAEALSSTTADILDNWSIPGENIITKGGGEQYFSTDKTSIGPID